MKKILTLIVLTICLFSASVGQTCDTLINVSLSGEDTSQYIRWQQPNIGYVSGNGAISDIQLTVAQTGVAEEFTAAVGAYISKAFIYPAYTTINPSDSLDSVTVYVYNSNGTAVEGPANAPGTALDSAKLTLKQLALAITATNNNPTPVWVTFMHQTPLPSASFYIGVSFTQNTGDTLVLFTNSGNTANGKGWLEIAQNVSPGWLAYDSIIPGINHLGIYIGAVVCNGVTGINEIDNRQSVKIYPNPTYDVLNLTFLQIANAEVSVIDLNGNVISSVYINDRTQQTLYNINSLAPGTYILRITNKNDNQQQRIVFCKI